MFRSLGMEDSDEVKADYKFFGSCSDEDLPQPYRGKKPQSPDTDDSGAGNAPKGPTPASLQEVTLHRKLSLSDSTDSSSVNENYEVQSLSSSLDDQLTWRGRMQVVLHSHWFHIAIVILVVMDAFIVLFELLLDVGAFNNIDCRGTTTISVAESCHYQIPDFCGPHAQLILDKHNITSSTGMGTGGDNLCSCKFRGGRRVCLPASAPDEVNPSLILHIGSLIILSLFVVEVLLKWIAFRLKYFTHKFEVFDGIIVFISFALDIASLVEEEAFEAASLLIILRLWRVVRIVNGAVLSAKTQSDQRLSEARYQAKKIIHAFHKCQTKLEKSEEDNAQLKRQLRLKGGAAVRVPRWGGEGGGEQSREEKERLLLQNEGKDTAQVETPDQEVSKM